jgi:hypothetical protein
MIEPDSKPETFDAILRERKSPLARTLTRHLDEIRGRATEDWMDFLGEDKGSRNGYVHLRNVERNADKMVPLAAKHSFSDGEIFLLLSSILLHDAGKIVPETAPIAYGSRKVDGAQEPGFRCPRKAWGHHCASKRLIDEQWAVFGLPDARIAGYCGLLAYAHNTPEPLDAVSTCLCDDGCILDYPKRAEYRTTSLEPYGVLRIPLLAAILRIADETENHWTRALRNEAYQLYLKSGRNLAKAFRRHVEDIEFCAVGHSIVMHVPRVSESDPEFEYLRLESLAVSGKNAERVVRAWGGALKPLGVVYDHVLFEHAGRLYRDPSQGFGEPPALTEVFPDDKDFIEGFLRASAEIAKRTCYERIPFSSVESAVGLCFDERHRWLIDRVAEVHGGLRIEKDGGSGQAWAVYDPGALESRSRASCGAAATPSASSASWLESDTGRAFQKIVELSKGTFGHKCFGWSAIEAAIGHRLAPAERGAIRKLSGIHEGFKIEPSQRPGDIDVTCDAHRYSEILRDLTSASCDPQGFRETKRKQRSLELCKRMHQLWSMTGGHSHFSWPAIEAHLREPLDREDREIFRAIEARWGIWRVAECGLQDCCWSVAAWNSAIAGLKGEAEPALQECK